METRSGVPPPRRAYRTDPASASDACASIPRVVGGGRGSPAAGCGDYDPCEGSLRTKAERGQTWHNVIADAFSEVVDFKAVRNCDEEQSLTEAGNARRRKPGKLYSSLMVSAPVFCFIGPTFILSALPDVVAHYPGNSSHVQFG